MKNIHLEISNVGPIEHVELNLNKINVLMGEQSSGKSTIAKIISFCNWVEKDISVNQSFKSYNSDKNFFIKRLETFHKMKGYFGPQSYIKYSSDTLVITYSWQDFNVKWVDKFAYKRNKISYIPAERSLAVLPEIEKVELPNNYLKSFLFDWLDARKNYSKKSKLPLIDIDANFYHSESNKESHIFNGKKEYDILLSEASSGLQSVTPLLVMIDHLTNKIYSEESSYIFDEIKMEVTQKLITELMIKPIYKKDFDDDIEGNRKVLEELNTKILENDEIVLKHFNRFRSVRNGLFDTHSTNFILEEPEQNLFPSTQKSLVYYLFESINKNPDHQLTLTTHSPYVLYAINNCIMAHLTHKNMSKNETDKLYCDKSKVDPTLISIYELKNGKIKSIQQEDGLIGDNFFDKKMKEVMNEFYVMLNHYE